MSRWLLFITSVCLAYGAVAARPPAIMNAQVYTPGIAVADYWVSEKLDGVRGRWDGAQLWTRGGHRIQAPVWFTANWPATPLDGELWIDRGQFERVSGIVRRNHPEDDDWRDLRFMVFDLPAHGGPFEQRMRAIPALLTPLDLAWLRPVAQFRVRDEAELEARLAEVIALGGEGLMLHHRDARYRAGRSDALLKLKAHEDAEAYVVGYRPGSGKYAGQMGALVVETPEGMRFALGSGFSDAQRADPPAIGARVTYRFNGHTINGVPRFARFLRVRDDEPSAAVRD